MADLPGSSAPLGSIPEKDLQESGSSGARTSRKRQAKGAGDLAKASKVTKSSLRAEECRQKALEKEFLKAQKRADQATTIAPSTNIAQDSCPAPLELPPLPELPFITTDPSLAEMSSDSEGELSSSSSSLQPTEARDFFDVALNRDRSFEQAPAAPAGSSVPV